MLSGQDASAKVICTVMALPSCTVTDNVSLEFRAVVHEESW